MIEKAQREDGVWVQMKIWKKFISQQNDNREGGLQCWHYVAGGIVIIVIIIVLVAVLV